MRLKQIKNITIIIALSALINSCLLVPIYKEQPILPPVSGIVKDALTNEIIENVQIYWIEPAGYQDKVVYSGKDGSFHLDRIDKYFTWKLIAMDPARWGGVLIALKQGYKEEQIKLNGPGYPNSEKNVEIKLYKVQ